MQRIEKRYGDRIDFRQVNFKSETELCYRLRVFTFPTVLYYLPGIGRVASAELTASTTDETVTCLLHTMHSHLHYPTISFIGELRAAWRLGDSPDPPSTAYPSHPLALCKLEAVGVFNRLLKGSARRYGAPT